ncbi:MAG: NAD-dependent epimerase/dehydratase family protein [Deltaproteobacteria bacterium]|jgi:nucleoside-diphosphate-sugar epimerase|nr:NAD-dependent epimerase/dehydratase family protein [Deltaproteobacteria bacterium]
MRVLVTGGSGYFGEILVERLRERGDEVVILDVIENADRPADVRFVQGDVRDRGAVDRAMEGVEVVHHNVAQVPLAKDREKFWSVNVDGTGNVLDAARAAGARKVVLMSSSAVHGVPERNPVDRSTPPAPREAYGRAKLEAERLAERARDRGLDVSMIRPRTILGHGRLGIFQILFEWVRRSKPLYLLGPGDNRYQFVHADDLADAALRAADRAGSALYLCGTDRFGTMGELLQSLVEHAGSASPIRSLPFRATQAAMVVTSKLGLSPLGDYHSLMYGRSMWFDISDAERELGWQPRYSNAEMIADSYDWYLEHRDEVLSRRDASHHRSPVKLGALKVLEHLPWPPAWLGS